MARAAAPAAAGTWSALPESNKFHFIVADAVVTPPPTQVACFRKAGRPTSFLSEGFKTAGRFHRRCSLFAGLERFLRQMCTAPGCCRPNRWRYVKAVHWWNGRESRSHAAQSFRASTQPFDFRTSMNRARNVSPTQQYPSSFHPSKYLCPSALTAEDTESYSLRKTWSPIKLTRCCVPQFYFQHIQSPSCTSRALFSVRLSGPPTST
jgi:hypothetical protein